MRSLAQKTASGAAERHQRLHRLVAALAGPVTVHHQSRIDLDARVGECLLGSRGRVPARVGRALDHRDPPGAAGDQVRNGCARPDLVVGRDEVDRRVVEGAADADDRRAHGRRTVRAVLGAAGRCDHDAVHAAVEHVVEEALSRSASPSVLQT